MKKKIEIIVLKAKKNLFEKTSKFQLPNLKVKSVYKHMQKLFCWDDFWSVDWNYNYDGLTPQEIIEDLNLKLKLRRNTTIFAIKIGQDDWYINEEFGVAHITTIDGRINPIIILRCENEWDFEILKTTIKLADVGFSMYNIDYFVYRCAKRSDDIGFQQHITGRIV